MSVRRTVVQLNKWSISDVLSEHRNGKNCEIVQTEDDTFFYRDGNLALHICNYQLTRDGITYCVICHTIFGAYLAKRYFTDVMYDLTPEDMSTIQLGFDRKI